MTKNFATATLIATIIVSTASAAKAAETDTIYVRAKAGPSYYSNLDPVSSTFGVGLDLGFRSANGFGLAGMAKLNFLGSATEEPSQNTSTRTEIKSVFFGIVPSYSVKKGIATLSFGLGVGAFSVTKQVDTFFSYPITSSPLLSPETSRARFALVPDVNIDFDIVSGLFANAGIQYIASFGESPKPGFISPMAGVGYRF